MPHRGTFRRALLPLAMGVACLSSVVSAQGLRVSNGSPEQIEALSSGQQLVLTDHSGAIQFAGRQIELSNFSGIVGYASDIAYVVAISGSAEADGNKAVRGRMLMIPPFGGELGVERFDAARLRDAWNEDIKVSAPLAYASLEDLAGGQATGVFLGRLGRTNFNVAASGLAKTELAKRTIVGGNAITDIRFDSSANSATFEKRIVSKFADALARSDAKTVAQFIDPLPFGNNDLRGGAGEARLLMAQNLIAERNWKSNVSGRQPVRDQQNSSLWVIQGPVSRTLITLRRTTDFAFVSNVKTGI